MSFLEVVREVSQAVVGGVVRGFVREVVWKVVREVVRGVVQEVDRLTPPHSSSTISTTTILCGVFIFKLHHQTDCTFRQLIVNTIALIVMSGIPPVTLQQCPSPPVCSFSTSPMWLNISQSNAKW